MEINFFNPRSVIVFVCLLQGSVFAVLLVGRWLRKRSWADFCLAVLLLLLCSSLVTPFIGFAHVYNNNRWLTYFPFHIAYSWGVCVYFYVLSLTSPERRFIQRDLLLFAPSAIYVTFRLALFAQSLEFKDWFDENYYVPLASPIVFVTEFAWTSALLFLSIRHYRRYREWLNDNFSETERIKFDWLRNFLYVFTFVFLLGGVFDLVDRFIFDLSYIQYFYFEIVLALTTYYLAVAGYTRFAPAVVPRSEEQTPEAVGDAAGSVPRASSRSGPDLGRQKFALESLMDVEKPYLEPQLTLSDLARRMGTNTSALSQVINQGFGVNFNDFVNGYRVEAVKKRLRDGAAEDLNLLGVALECGFNSKATFNRVFKKLTGRSPKEYQSDPQKGSNPDETSQTA